MERIEYTRPPDLHGVDVMLAERVARRWRVFHETYAICTVLDADGEAEITYRGKLYRANAGEILLMEPGELHANTRITPPGTFRVLSVPPSLVAQAAGELGMGESPHWRYAKVSSPDYFRAFARLHASLEAPATALERESHFTECMNLLLNQCTEAGERRSGRAPPGNVRRCKDFILEHYAQPLTLDELARVSALSRFHLVRAFGAFFGLAPHAFQIHVRIEKAQRLLDAGLPPVSVAAETGFADQSHFTHHFARITGVTPGRYARG